MNDIKVDGEVTVTAPGTTIGLLSAYLSTSGMTSGWLVKKTKLDARTINKVIEGEACRPSTAQQIAGAAGLVGFARFIRDGDLRGSWSLVYHPTGSACVKGEMTDSQYEQYEAEIASMSEAKP